MTARPFIFCLVPVDLAGEVLEPLRRHFADEPMIDVIVERRDARGGESLDDRVRRELATKQYSDQRAPVVPRAQLIASLPPELAEHADRLSFQQRLTPVREGLEERDLLELVEMIRAGDPDAPTELYWRSFERVRRRLELGLRSTADADAAVKATFGRVFDQLPAYDTEKHSLAAWLDAIVDAHVAELQREKAV